MNDTKKDFDGWISVKSNLHYAGIFRSVKEGEQVRVMSVYRLCRKMGSLLNSDLLLVRGGFKRLYC